MTHTDPDRSSGQDDSEAPAEAPESEIRWTTEGWKAREEEQGPAPHLSKTQLADTVTSNKTPWGPPERRSGSGIAPPDSRTPGLSTTSIDGARFVPGTVFAGRYRLSGLLGQGGMGEVYRAEDLKLGEPVALKLLPESLTYDGPALARFHREVRIARQIAHGNVCRVFDIGEADGVSFLTMELIDGEDLATLLRRIGRLAPDKALDLARQISAGLAAVHERGILHRDLKPANVMIDREGRAKLTDFGLAHLAGEARDIEVAGTPAYMAPEIIEGLAGPTSDLYSLGLVIYEMLTGRRLFVKAGVMERIRSGNRLRLELNIEGLPAEIEPLLERCLDLDPERRPKTALEVLITLSGGDPLQAALDAGETPSPEMVARVRRRGTLRPKVAGAWLTIFVVSLLVILLGAEATTFLGLGAPERPPAALADRAETLLDALGWDLPRNDRAWGFELDDGLRRRNEQETSAGGRLEPADPRPAALGFWYRQSPADLVPQGRWQYHATRTDPPFDRPGMATVVLDGRGRLQSLMIRPEAGLASPGSAASDPAGETVDWSFLLRRAGLDPGQLHPTEPIALPPVWADQAIAWTTDSAGSMLRVEAAAWQGRPVFFRILRDEPPPDALTSGPFWWLAMNAFFLLLWVAGLAQAHRNQVLGRGDRDAAFALFLVGVLGSLAAWLLEAHHTASVEELQLLFNRLGSALMRGALLWLLYMALEPTVRRRWPSSIVSWSRLLAGDRRDPLVGRDLLLGTTLYLALHGLGQLVHWGLLSVGFGSPTTIQDLAVKISGFRYAAAAFLGAVTWLPVLTALGVLFLLVTLRRWLRPGLASTVVGLLLFVLAWADPSVSLPGAIAYAVAMAVAAERWGLLALVGIGIAVELVVFAPLTLDTHTWYFSAMTLGVGATLSLGIWSFRRSLGDHRLVMTR